jgi:hypothetical protein
MPCYSYSSGSIINYVGNVERIYNASGTVYSFADIARICETPSQDQICVFVTSGEGFPETQLSYVDVKTLASHFSITNENIILHTAPIGQVIIRRCTNSTKMLYKFTDGAKLTATQLNASLHQLLFITQEKEFSSQVKNFIYPISSNILPWSGATTYSVLNYATYAGRIWQATGTTTNNAPFVGSGYWTAVEFANRGFHLIGGTAGVPLIINLNNIEVGKALVWSGSEFVAGYISGILDNLADVDVTTTPPVLGDILVYSAGSQWKNKVPTIDITLANIVFPNFAFTAVGLPNSYTSNNTSITAPAGGQLNEFRNGSNQWVLTTPPTVYHIIKKSLPASADPIDFFNLVNNNINTFAANAGNPIKVKFEWDLGWKRLAAPDAGNGDNLRSYKNMFWDNPNELYALNMWSLGITASGIKYHGVTTGGTIYRDTPYAYQTETAGVQTTDSKFNSYGVYPKGFYLNIPESSSTNLRSLKAVGTDGNFYKLSSPNGAAAITSDELITYLNALYGYNLGRIDYYLQQLRNFAFASLRSDPGFVAFSTAKADEQTARYQKARFIFATYSPFEDISYKRHEIVENADTVLWKIPKVMIYYNRAAIALSNDTVTGQTSNTAASTLATAGFFKKIRFSGHGEFHGVVGSYPNSTLTAEGLGFPFKADSYWADWVSKWSTDGGTTQDLYSYGEADIDWMYADMTSTISGFNLVDNVHFSAETLIPKELNRAAQFGGQHYPWTFRPNQFRYTNDQGTTGARGGTHSLNIDANKLFSESDQFVDPPMDEYIFRIVCTATTTATFVALPSERLRTSMILEYGLSSGTANHSTTAKTTKTAIYDNHTLDALSELAYSRFDVSKFKVSILSEHIETIGGNPHLVVNLCIRTPRAKYIGYTSIFRRFNTGNSLLSYPQFNSAGYDTEKGGGPWNFGHMMSSNRAIPSSVDAIGITDNVAGTGGSSWWWGSSHSVIANRYTTLKESTFDPDIITTIDTALDAYDVGTGDWYSNSPMISGRNECAVKFVRLGIPSNLWIKLSILNSDGTTDPLNNLGIWS